MVHVPQLCASASERTHFGWLLLKLAVEIAESLHQEENQKSKWLINNLVGSMCNRL